MLFGTNGNASAEQALSNAKLEEIGQTVVCVKMI
jgi:hypothetical protein